jgi:rubrerythrin
MSAMYNAREVFEIAEEIEHNGARFYRRAAELAEGWPDAQAVLTRLAAMEDEHEKLFRAMKQEFAPADGQATLPDPDGQALTYLREMGDAQVFGNREDLAARLTDAISLVEIYRMAIGFEKDSVLFFTAIRKLVPNDLGKNRIDMLITEEVSHVALLSRELKRIGTAADA